MSSPRLARMDHPRLGRLVRPPLREDGRRASGGQAPGMDRAGGTAARWRRNACEGDELVDQVSVLDVGPVVTPTRFVDDERLAVPHVVARGYPLEPGRAGG